MVRQPFTIEYALLGMMQFQPMHGYDIFLRLSKPEGLGLIWKLKQSQLYALLDRLTESGYLSSHIETQVNRPSRVIFSITEAGTKTFANWINTPVRHHRQLRLEFLGKYYFALEQPGRAKQLLSAQKEICEQWLQGTSDPREGNALRPSFDRAVNDFRHAQIQSILTWIDSELARLPITD